MGIKLNLDKPIKYKNSKHKTKEVKVLYRNNDYEFAVIYILWSTDKYTVRKYDYNYIDDIFVNIETNNGQVNTSLTEPNDDIKMLSDKKEVLTTSYNVEFKGELFCVKEIDDGKSVSLEIKLLEMSNLYSELFAKIFMQILCDKLRGEK